MNTKTLHRTLELDADRADPEARTVPATISTISPVERDGFTEVLSHDPGAIDLSRAPLPLIEGHDARQTNIGTVTDLKADGARLRGLVRFGSSARAKELLRDVTDRIVSGLSVGYRITKAEESPDGRTLTALRWQPFEVSITGVPADTNSGFYRSSRMETTTEDTTQQTTTTRGADPVQTERKRISEIMRLCERSGFPALAADMIQNGTTLDAAREAITEKLIERAGPEIRNDAPMSVSSHGGYGADHFQRAAIDALLLRDRVPVKDPHPGARDLVRASVVSLAETCLHQAGADTRGLNNSQIIGRAITHSTSDFPDLLSNLAGKAMMNGFEMEPASHRQWVREVMVPDFKTQTRIRLSGAPALLEVPENAEYQHGTMSDEAESYAVVSYGRILNLSRQMMVNDDLSAFTTVPRALGQSARRKESDLVYAELTDNGNMRDGEALFSSAHANTTTGAITLANLGAAKAKMRKQTAPGGALMNIVPRYLIVPAVLETTAEALLSSVEIELDGTNEQVQNLSWVRGLVLVVEPRLDSDSEAQWYLAADAGQVDTIETARLSDGVEITQQESFEVAGVKIRATLDFAAKALDWRGLVRSSGS